VVSDISFLAAGDGGDAATAAANTPVRAEELFGSVAKPPGVPMVNAGPWGRGYHGPLERVHARYAFDVLPDLVGALSREMIAA
jgi:arginine utilization protein RocB